VTAALKLTPPSATFEAHFDLRLARIHRLRRKRNVPAVHAELQAMVMLAEREMRAQQPPPAPTCAEGWVWMQRGGTKVHAFRTGSDGNSPFTASLSDCGFVARDEDWICAPRTHETACVHCYVRCR
jgi:hypothetical protein